MILVEALNLSAALTPDEAIIGHRDSGVPQRLCLELGDGQIPSQPFTEPRAMLDFIRPLLGRKLPHVRAGVLPLRCLHRGKTLPLSGEQRRRLANDVRRLVPLSEGPVDVREEARVHACRVLGKAQLAVETIRHREAHGTDGILCPRRPFETVRCYSDTRPTHEQRGETDSERNARDAPRRRTHAMGIGDHRVDLDLRSRRRSRARVIEQIVKRVGGHGASFDQGAGGCLHSIRVRLRAERPSPRGKLHHRERAINDLAEVHTPGALPRPLLYGRHDRSPIRRTDDGVTQLVDTGPSHPIRHDSCDARPADRCLALEFIVEFHLAGVHEREREAVRSEPVRKHPESSAYLRVNVCRRVLPTETHRKLGDPLVETAPQHIGLRREVVEEARPAHTGAPRDV